MCLGASLLDMETRVTRLQYLRAGGIKQEAEQKVNVDTEPRFWGSCRGISNAIPLEMSLNSPNNRTPTLGLILEMPPREFHSSAKLSKFTLLLCFEPIQLHLSVNSQALINKMIQVFHLCVYLVGIQKRFRLQSA